MYTCINSHYFNFVVYNTVHIQCMQVALRINFNNGAFISGSMVVLPTYTYMFGIIKMIIIIYTIEQ